MLRRYETLILTVPEITQDEIKNIESQLDGLVRKAKGTTISFERWGKYKLAYPVSKNDYGVYFLMRFEVPQDVNLLKDIDTLFKIKLNNVVVRSILDRLNFDASMVYQRPKSLEEGNSTETGSFLKEKKVESLLSAVKSSSGKKDETTSEQTEKKSEETKDLSANHSSNSSTEAATEVLTKNTDEASAKTDQEPTGN